MAKKMKECPFCGVEVNKANLEKHFLKAHDDLDERDFNVKGFQKPKGINLEESKEEKRITRRRKPKKRDTVGIVVSVIAVVVVISLVGFGIYYVLLRDSETDNGDDGGKTIAVMSTSLGTIKIELFMEEAPITAGNFRNLIASGFYNGLIFHRVIPDFVIQGGGFKSDGTQQNAPNIQWEDTGLLNKRYTLSMARSGDANKEADSGTATTQFFINTVDNPSLDSPTVTYPYVVFAEVIEGFGVVETIEALPTGTYNGHQNWPDDPPVIISTFIEE